MWFWYCLKARSLWFFTPSNPTLTFGGFEGESKKEMYEQLPPSSYPKTVYIKPNIPFSEVLQIIKAAGFTLFAQNSLRFAKTWTAELSGFYNAPSIDQGAFKGKGMWAIDAGVQKQLFANRATVKLSVSDIFNSMRFSGSTDFVGQKSTFTSKWESQQFKLSMNFRFGNNGVKAARSRGTGAEEETKRVQQGGGVGIGN